ncbi:MAG: hypothetical protein AAF532_15230 [Planctomycetota bacterium]
MFGVHVNMNAGLIPGPVMPVKTPDGQPLWRYEIHFNGREVELIERDLGFEVNWPKIGDVGSRFPTETVATEWIVHDILGSPIMPSGAMNVLDRLGVESEQIAFDDFGSSGR